mmetsp:Transcript_4077/g.6003  ORF Transcript_4077/g.6003 Transcript_4077/m.6003 type:complete len:139 (-) Transcript_4077:1242-1658(-)
MRRKHFYKRSKEPVDVCWTLFLIAALQVSVWSFGVWQQPFQQFLVTFQQGVRGERPNSQLSWDKPLPTLSQQLIELSVFRDALNSGTLKVAGEEYLSKSTPKLEHRIESSSAQQLAVLSTQIFLEEADEAEKDTKKSN